MATLVVTITTNRDVSTFKQNAQSHENLARLSNFFNGISSGALQGKVEIQSAAANPALAVGSIAITHANVTNADTTTICNVVITAATSGNGTTSWTIGADATADAVAMAACINANTTLNKMIVASIAVAGTVTLTTRQKGVIGNGLALTTSDATAFTLTAFSTGAGGATDAAVTIEM